MRITGTDAAQTLPYTSVQTAGTAADTVDVDTKSTKDNTTQINNISQLTKFDKMELPISQRVVVEALEKVNKAIEGSDRSFKYSVNEKTNDVVVKVIDTDTNEVIREIPPQKVLDLVNNLLDMAGIMVDERR